MIRFFLLVILVWVVSRSLRSLLRGVAEGMSGGGTRDVPATNLVRDPVCGTFVVPDRALSATRGAEIKYFCSNKCRQAWITR